MQVSGLEITDSKISLLALKSFGNKLRVFTFAEKDLAPGVIENGILKDPQALASALLLLKKEARPKKVPSRYVIVSLPEDLVYLTIKPMPSLEPDKMREAVEINSQDFLPGDPKDIYWGWQEIVTREKGKGILIASSRKDNLAKFLESFSAASLIPIALEPFSLSSERAFNKIPQALIISVEKNYATAFVIAEDAIRFSTSFNFSDGMELVKQTKKVLNFYLAEKKIDNIPVFLAGSAATPEVIKGLSDHLKMEVKGTQEQMIFHEDRIKSPAVLGAALRGLISQKDDKNLSLLPVGTQEAYEEKRVLNFVGGVTNLVAITSFLVLLIFFGFWGFLYYLNGTLDQQIQNLSKSPTNSEQDEIQKNLQSINPKLSYMKELLAAETPFSAVLSTVNDAAGGGITFTSIALPKDGKTMTINGNAQSRDTLVSFKDTLNKSSAFSKVDFSSTTVGETNTSFTVNLTLKGK